jgi:hypothetical protein
MRPSLHQVLGDYGTSSGKDEDPRARQKCEPPLREAAQRKVKGPVAAPLACVKLLYPAWGAARDRQERISYSARAEKVPDAPAASEPIG